MVIIFIIKLDIAYCNSFKMRVFLDKMVALFTNNTKPRNTNLKFLYTQTGSIIFLLLSIFLHTTNLLYLLQFESLFSLSLNIHVLFSQKGYALYSIFHQIRLLISHAVPRHTHESLCLDHHWNRLVDEHLQMNC